MNIAEYKDIYVFCEERDGKIYDSSLELLGEAVRLVKDRPSINYKVVAIIIGNYSDELIDSAGHYGADHVIYLHNDKLNHYSTEIYTSLLMDLIKQDKPDIILIPATVMGRDLAPRLAARCDTGLTADATKLAFDPENEDSPLLYVTRPAFGGNLFGTIINETKRPQMTTIRPGVMERIKKDKSRKFTIDKREVEIDEIKDSVKLLDILKREVMAVDITKADIILSGGRGVGDNFDVLRECAEMIGAVVGASRGAVDKGFIDKDHQVGQTGKTVRPKVYIACGISGAVQHLAGMEKSDYIIAINKDPDAAIFSVANIGLVGDALEILPLLTEEIKLYRERPF
ncbi:MAG: electron transfer flavoprotein subunit alpha/FixB family protein [Gudongella sp.]|nr:electron transfer flavoprotein subunit alpha/FixB family protein [Gudongella sp.]